MSEIKPAHAFSVHWAFMDLVELIFGRSPPAHAGACIRTPPKGVAWRTVIWRETNAPVRAELAPRNGSVVSDRGELSYRKGRHYIVEDESGAKSVVRKDIFERTYRRRGDGAYEKRTDLTFRYFTLPNAATIMTLEGPQRAEPGDWIMQGVAGELWPIRAAEAERKYVAA